MELTRPKHDSGLGIYAKSIPVKSEADRVRAKSEAEELIAWLDEHNGSFKGEHNNAYAIAHCQVRAVAEPLQMFVVAKELADIPKNKKEQSFEDFHFEGRAILNAEILEAPKEIEKQVPKRTMVRDEEDPTQFHVETVMETKMVDNTITVPEACMSFNHRKAKNIDRYHTVRVRYEYVTDRGKTKTFEGWVKGLKAHILQHETEHFQGQNIFYNKL